MARDMNLCVLVKLIVIQTLIGTSLEIIEANVIQVWSPPGGTTRLPCDLAAPARDVAMTLWFKDGDRMPIYTVDFRNGPPVHWAVAGEFGTRSHFVLNESDPSSAHLAVDKVARYDEGIYRCRVDYVDSPTRNYRVNLTVVVPPESPRIYDSDGQEITGSIAGPFREGSNLLLSCQAAGGKPAPDVSWYRGQERLAVTKGGSVCQLHLQRLSREFSGTTLQCRVEPPLLKAQYRDVTIKLFLKPQFVRVTGSGTTRAGHERSFVCTTRGSKPAPNIDWFINSQRIDSAMTEMDVEGEVTRSVLTWRVRREDSGRQLVCRVSNPWFPAYTLEDSVTLDVFYPPVAQISIASPKESHLLREDGDAVLICSSDASPPATNFTFYKGLQDHLIHDDPIGGISVEGNRLILRGLRRHHSERYRCRARNSEGSGLSEPLTLNVLSRPECSAGSIVQQLAGAPGGEVRARCSVTAPSSRDAGPLRFYWTYNGTKDVLPIPAANITVSGSSSTVIHGLPDSSSDDLGWLACWASNDIGNQRDPCLFRIMPAAYPEPPSNCEIEDEILRCEAGHDGGLPQRFILEALEVRPRDPDPRELDGDSMSDQGISGRGLSETVYRASNDVIPQFPLDALSPGRYTFLVYSETPRGRSQRPAALHSVPIRTIDDLDRPGSLQTMTPGPPQPTPSDNSVALLIGAALALVLLTILTTLCVTLVVMCKKKTRPRGENDESTVLRRSVGVSMYGGSMTQSVMPTVVVRGHRGSRVLAARWSGVLDDTPLAVLALDTRAHVDTDSCRSDMEHQETDLTSNVGDMETQTDP
ncbi:PREDICTED: nephrin-like [Papilio xuthus]|uniref:Nephrin-like n=2 Tax=Papilio xuthus TaxID=66420 RepID=A0AAJ6ZF49_PAPXU|nr:PREDICTED: nephrin-like [Papilio xuthus]XP_013171193.1 PREDICTED: nephrin-like [Papilio xuthus]